MGVRASTWSDAGILPDCMSSKGPASRHGISHPSGLNLLAARGVIALTMPTLTSSLRVGRYDNENHWRQFERMDAGRANWKYGWS